MNKFGVIYKFTNIINNKVYIGQTIRIDPFIRINKHFKKEKSRDLLYESIQKYGKNNFTIDIICSSLDTKYLNDLEIFFISYFNSIVPNGYNIKSGGNQGGKCSNDLKNLISERLKNYYKTHISFNRGKKFTKEHIANMSKVRKGFTSEARKLANKNCKYKIQIKVIAINIKTKETKEYPSISDCAKSLNLDPTCVSRVLNNIKYRKQHKGYKFFNKEIDKKEESC